MSKSKIKWLSKGNKFYGTIRNYFGGSMLVQIQPMCDTSREKQKKIVNLIEKFYQGIDDELSVDELKQIIDEIRNIKIRSGDPTTEISIMLSAYEFDKEYKKEPEILENGIRSPQALSCLINDETNNHPYKVMVENNSTKEQKELRIFWSGTASFSPDIFPDSSVVCRNGLGDIRAIYEAEYIKLYIEYQKLVAQK